ncbi:hypothetical protein CcaverHIS002_0403950 [Cutaneotrichosporon cavernicola]|uniref:Translation initiation factor eIF2B subunit epsilon n=1 Tax=Cutaneotrichosporon cavernicola TaxID=279322 RepID=A0AA48L430_9TREE|nr:uncharacterized protein CcaverHIS019_0403900 [Cutaneotrichosporon cavernicola]BEI83791.1 hypothetical protein CcaverHIS002_0403950 [Cutaneotrichosporon cavernicola]BEI91570.1 hypothetical protein CcaverHIS019_0403900 [Cutaneotrichosporon cavernicola]BEI99347.1 hypothetical protein CcaverHIS631_0403900 [Cutaneotrichosporon cavernicola]BEJ07122.1 hypothetical protein CcaverHIS641_0403910 [Cutaneotrichosporon cavernicola]
MPPKKQASKPEPKRAENGDEPVLQAVVLADSYNRRFEVLCLDQPRILLPLCGIPLLTYTLESLSLSKVKQVFIFCGVHADKIREFVANSPFNRLLDIQCLASQTARSGGDALRELDDMGLLNPENPFVLVHTPIVSNYDISQMVDAHRKRRETDKNLIMTMGIGRGGRQHPEAPIMMVHPPSSRLLHYSLNPISPAQKHVEFPSQLFLDPWPPTIDEYEIWSGTNPASSQGGYRDLGIDICEADVPALCTENFDYHDLRRHFVNGVLTSELLGKNINVHVVGDETLEDPKERRATSGRYVERVRDTRTYGEITQDLLRRWVFPLVPDIGVHGTQSFELRRGNVYIAHDNVILSRTTTLQGPLLIGAKSVLNNNTRIVQSSLGMQCRVGAHTTILSSYIFNDVTIGDDCFLDECMIGNNVVIHSGAHIGKGALIGDGVTIGKGVKIPMFARVGREPHRPEGWDSEDEEDPERVEGLKQLNLDILGSESTGFFWPAEEEESSEDSDDEAEDPFEHASNKRLLQLGRRLSNLSVSDVSVSTLSIASSEEEEDMDELDLGLGDLNLGAGDLKEFKEECKISLQRAYTEGHTVQNASLELKTLVMGFDSGIDPAREQVVTFFMSQMSLEGGLAQILADATKIWARWGGMAVNLSRDGSDIALDIQTFCVRNPDYIPYFGLFLRALYDSDVVDEDALIEWRSLPAARGEGAQVDEKTAYAEAFAKGKQYVDILEDMESDDDDDEDDDEDEDSE